MGSTANRLLHFRRNLYPGLRHHQYYIHHSFSSSPDPPPATPQPEDNSETRSSFSTYFKEVKANLHNVPPPRNPQSPRKPISFSYPRGSPPSEKVSLEEIQKNLSEFRSRSAAPPPSSSNLSGRRISFQELYEKNVSSKIGSSDTAAEIPRDSAPGGRSGMEAIKQSLRRLRAASASQVSQDGSGGKTGYQMPKLGEMNAYPETFGLGDSFPSSSIGKGLTGRFNKDSAAVAAAAGMRTEFGLLYTYQDLGRKLGTLRPEKKKRKWFSLQELSDRLAKLREIEDKEREGRSMGILFKDVREGLENIMKSNNEETNRATTVQGLDILGQLGGTPSYMLSPPKEHLAQKYFHTDHMSSAEKLKLKLKQVRDEFKMSESDCGSARVQVAQLTTKIKHLSNVLLKKDKHSRKGLQEMVQRRKKLLKYLRRTDWDSYTLVLSKLGLRDNPESKHRVLS